MGKVTGRKNIRLREYDYSSDGSYFLTICTKDREHYFGEIQERKMILSRIGEITRGCLLDIPKHFANTKLDEFVIMPNHVHCILNLEQSAVGTQHVVSLPNESNNVVGTSHVMSLQKEQNQNEFSKPIKGSVSVIVQQFKSSVKRICNQNGFSHFHWQSRFHDHVIRNYESFLEIKNYIRNNEANWHADSLNKINSKEV